MSYLPIFQSSDNKKQQQVRNLTHMALGIGILFIICESPRGIMPIYARFQPMTYTARIINSATWLISGTNHAGNFFVYVFRGTLLNSSIPPLLSQTMSGPNLI